MAVVRVLSRGQVTLPRQVRREAGIEAGDALNVEVLGPGLVQFRVLPRLSPRELRERYLIEGPVDETADREAWQAAAAREVLGE
ncbi:MAG: AbrB/MazE/SpoVT family DNA-binding domain-containing protein [Anaerolineae bacterium]|nr:AbrB/MazE/SpoVT family DNA-binding domain-containing protein [Anaerolineae bacterium]